MKSISSRLGVIVIVIALAVFALIITATAPFDKSSPIPEGATYTVAATGDVLKAGDPFPETVANGDIYTYGNYEYRYNRYQSFGSWYPRSQNGWGVHCVAPHLTDPGAILESINGKPITCLHGTFSYCVALTTAPVIPAGVTDMCYTFYNCWNLTTAPVIPSNVTDMSCTFSGCTALADSITINANFILDYNYCLKGTQITEILGNCINRAKILATK